MLTLDLQALPRRPNLHWLGEQPQRLLPALMSRWRVALLPFVKSATPPTDVPLSALEALGAGLPVVATPLPGVRGRSWDIAAARLGEWLQGRVGRTDGAHASETLAVLDAAM